MRRCAFAASVLLLTCFAPGRAQDEATKKELARLAGSWRLVRGEENGEAAGQYALDNLKCVIAGDQLTFKGIEPLTDKASKLRITVDTTTTPRCMDLKVEAGSLKGEILEGAYEWKGNEFKICLNLGKGNRPLDFRTTPGSNRVLFVLKRDEP